MFSIKLKFELISLALIAFLAVTPPLQAQIDLTKPLEKDDNTIMLLHFEEGALTENAGDYSADATINGDVQIVSSVPNTELGDALYLQNENESDTANVMIPHSDALNLSGDFTIEGWFYPITYTHPDEFNWRWHPELIEKGNLHKDGGQLGYNLYMHGVTHALEFRVRHPVAGCCPVIGTSAGSVGLQKWYHFIVVQDADANVKALLLHSADGEGNITLEEMVVASADDPTTPNENPLYIGRTGRGGSGFDGFVDEFRISDVVRSHAYPPIIPEVEAVVGERRGGNIQANEQAVISAKVLGLGGMAIDQVTLHYELNGVWEEKSMSAAGEGYFEASISGQPAGTEVRYYVTAETGLGTSARSPGVANQYHGVGWWNEDDRTLDLTFEEGQGEIQDQSGYDNSPTIHGNNWGYDSDVPAAISGESEYSLAMNSDYAEVDTTFLEIPAPTTFLNGPAEGYVFDFWFKIDSIWKEAAGGPRNDVAVFRREDWTTGLYVSEEGWGVKQPAPRMGYVNFASMNGAITPEDPTGHWYRMRLGRTDSYIFGQIRDSADNIIDEKIMEFDVDLTSLANDPPMNYKTLLMGRWKKWTVFFGNLDNIRWYNYPFGVPPAFVNLQTPEILTPEDEATIYTGIESPGTTIDTPILHYSTNEGESWENVNLTSSNGTYSATIPAQSPGNIAYYWLEVQTESDQVATYPTNVLRDSAYSNVRWWQENDQTLHLSGEGDVASDESQYSHTVNVVGDVTLSDTTKIGNKSIYFPGTVGSYLEVPPPTFLTSKDFTLDFWFRPDSIPPQEDNFLMTKTSIAEGIEGQLRAKFNDPGESLSFTTIFYKDGDDDDVEIEIGDVQFVPERWYRVHYEYVGRLDTAFAQVYDGDGALLKEEGTSKDLGLPYMDDGPLRIGAGEVDNEEHIFKGWIDDVKWYNYSTTLDTVTAVNDEPLVPTKVALSQNYPNPFNPSTQINFAIPEAQHVTLVVYDLLGRQVKVLRDAQLQTGRYTISWDGTNEHGEIVSSGIYFYRLEAGKGNVTKIRKMVLLR